MPLFQTSVVDKYLKTLDKQVLHDAFGRFKAHFHNPVIRENIMNSKEEQYQGEFLIDLFVNVLGYTKHPAPDFNLTTEYKNVKDSKKALELKAKIDATDKEIDRMVYELYGLTGEEIRIVEGS